MLISGCFIIGDIEISYYMGYVKTSIMYFAIINIVMYKFILL